MKEAEDSAVRKGDEIRFGNGKVARVEDVGGPDQLGAITYRMDCDAHNYHTYSRCAWWWHLFWVHIIGF